MSESESNAENQETVQVESLAGAGTSGWEMPEGFRIAACDAGIAKGERPDLMLAVAEEAFPAACLFTINRIIAAPVALSREHLRRSDGRVRAILVNAGNANACTGPEGDQDAHREAEVLARALDCPLEQVLIFSTGVIGQRLPVERIEAAIPGLLGNLGGEVEGILAAAEAIRTTDTRTKAARAVLPPGEEQPAGQVLGLAKGSGMIHPDMATMLGFLFSDVRPGLSLDMALRAAIEASFHRITVDGDSSTNDAVLLWSSERREAEAAPFVEALDGVCLHLAREIARDGEGATKLIEVRVREASTEADARRCVRTICQSLLVKTAVHGGDPNWGRILAAAGRSGVEMDTRKVRVGIGESVLFEEDRPRPEAEAAAAEHLNGDEVLLWVDLGVGPLEARGYTCDLSDGYVRINADYRS